MLWPVVVYLTPLYFTPAPVAQLDRVADFESEGRRFESSRARQCETRMAIGFAGYFISWKDSAEKRLYAHPIQLAGSLSPKHLVKDSFQWLGENSLSPRDTRVMMISRLAGFSEVAVMFATKEGDL